MYDDYFRNYNPQSTYQNSYDEYLDYENYSMDNEYDSFMTRPVSNTPYNYNFNGACMDVSNMYPNIYKQISPIIEKKLNSNPLRSIDNATLEKLTFEIYDEIAKTDIGKKLNIQVNTTNTCYTSKVNSQNSTSNKITNQGLSKYSPVPSTTASSQNSSKDNVREVSNQPSRSNCLLCDLIKIMLLNKWRENQMPPKHGPRPPIRRNPRQPIPWSQNIVPNGSNYYGTNMQNQVASQRPSYFDVPYPEDFGY